MDDVRWAVALLAIIAYPPVIIFWFLVHPFVRFWRRQGLAATYVATFTVMAAVGWAFYANRARILAVDYGTSWVLISLAAVSMVVGLTIEVRCRRQLTLSTLVGVPELRHEDRAGRLLQDGIYAHVRHPRYLGGMFGLLAVALFANNLAAYIIAALYVPLIYLVIVLEERELVQRFGDAYRQYQRRVPRFVPRLVVGSSQQEEG